MERMAELLAQTAAKSKVAVVTMTGSCCPATLAHVGSFVESRSLLPGFDQVIGLIFLNSDAHVSKKLAAKGETTISLSDRAHLVGLATAEYDWIGPGHQLCARAFMSVDALKSRHPALHFVHYELNGADDVIKYRKWGQCDARHRMIAMCRPGYTEKLLANLKADKVDLKAGHLIVGPEMPDISSSAVRKALLAGDTAALEGMLHPDVAGWCLEQEPYKSMSRRTAQASSALGAGVPAARSVRFRCPEGQAVLVRDPSTGDALTTSVLNGQVVDVGREEGDFVWVATEHGLQGHVRSTYITPTAATLLSDVVLVSQAQETAAPVPGQPQVASGEAVSIIAREGPFACVQSGTRSPGWLHSRHLRVTKGTVQRLDHIKSTGLRKIATPDRVFISREELVVKNGECLTWLEECRGFTRVQTERGIRGYVNTTHLS